MSQAPVFTSLANDGNEPLIAGAEKKRKRCNFKDCEKQAVKGGVCCKHGAKRKCYDTYSVTVPRGILDSTWSDTTASRAVSIAGGLPSASS